MLVLSRHRGEVIVLGREPNLILLHVVEIRGDKVRIGVDAPSDVPVHRKEVYDAIQNGEPFNKKAPSDKAPVSRPAETRKTGLAGIVAPITRPAQAES